MDEEELLKRLNQQQGKSDLDVDKMMEMEQKATQARQKRTHTRKIHENRRIEKFQDNQDLESDSSSDSSGDDSDNSQDSYEKKQQMKQQFKKNEQDLKIKKIKNQVEYFGYVMEPLNMKNERGQGEMDQAGFFVVDKNKETKQSDPWLQQLDFQDRNMMQKLLKKRKQQGVFSDEENDSHEEGEEGEEEQEDEYDENGQKMLKQKPVKKVKTNNEENEMKNLMANAPIFMIKQKLAQLLDENTTPNQMFIKLQKIFQYKPEAVNVKPPIFKKNIRKKDRELMEQQAKQAAEEQAKLGEKYSEDEKSTAKGTFDMIVDMSDIILQRTGNGAIYTQTKETILKNLQEQMTGEQESDSEGKSNDEHEESSDSDDSSDGEEQQQQLAEGEKKVRFAIPSSKKKNKKEQQHDDDIEEELQINEKKNKKQQQNSEDEDLQINQKKPQLSQQEKDDNDDEDDDIF